MRDAGSSGPAEYHRQRGWWHRLRTWPARLRHLREVAENEYVPATSPRSSRWATTLWIVAMMLLLPVVSLLRPLLLRSIFHITAAKKLRAEARERWTTNPHEALSLLKDVCLALREARRAGRIKVWRGSVEIAPYGRFRLSDSIFLDDALYSYAYALGDYEAALDACSAEPPLLVSTIGQQVDCLVAMRRREDAITLLWKNLHLDNRRGDLHRRLGELSGRRPGGSGASGDQSN